jgi:hypothetical protein
MLKEAREIKRKWLLMQKRSASSSLKMIETSKQQLKAKKMQLWQN